MIESKVDAGRHFCSYEGVGSGRKESSQTETFSATATAAGTGARPSTSRVALFVHHPGRAEVVLLEPDVPLLLGRAPARGTPGLRIEDRTLSREHARFVLSGGRVRVEDLGSKNGVRSLGRRVDRAELEVGDEVVLGGVRVRVEALGPSGESLGIDGEDAFRRHMDEEVARARLFRRPFALLLVRAVDPRTGEVSAAGSRDRPWLEALRGRLRPVDRIAVYGLDAAQVLLPETGAEDAARIAHAVAVPLPEVDARLLVGVAVHAGAGDTADELIERSREALRRASPSRPVALTTPAMWTADPTAEGTVVSGAAMIDVLATVKRVADSRLPVILYGETGTGKEVLARLLHDEGPRKARRMVCINCAAIPKDLVESTLFGHERGAFTHAMQQQKGVFEEADGGTVFLDEIGELPPSAQAALLRVLETQTFSRVGSVREISVDVRVVAATHRDLEAMAASGAFRLDLYYRLGGVSIEIPPLRQRTDEIEPLARRFLHMANEANGRSVQGIDAEAVKILKAYPWPGNVRELRNAIDRAVVVARGEVIGPEDLPARVRTLRAPAEQKGDPRGTLPSDRPSSKPPVAIAPVALIPEEGSVRDMVQDYEAKILHSALEASGWSRTETAKKLGISVRTLSYRMKVLGLRRPEDKS